MTIDAVQYARRWKTLGVLSLSLVIIGLDNTILNVALPTLQAEFDASASKLQWMVDSYLLVFAGLLLVFGVLGDRFGRKRALQAGVSIFGLASLGALVADSADQVIAVRAAMGVGAALIMPATLSIIANLFTGKERGKAIAIWAALAAVGIGLGPLTGGLLLEWFDWSSVFMVNVPFAVAALLLGIRYVPESRDPRPGRFDLLGAALSTAGFSVLVYAIIEAPGLGWTSGLILGLLTASVMLLGAFLWWERRIDEPMLDFGFFRSAGFSVGTAAVSVAFFVLLGGIFALTQYLQFAHGFSAIEAGAVMSPMALGLMMGAGSSSRAVARLGRSRVVAAGLIGLAIVFALTALWEPDTGTLALMGWFFVLALSMGWVMAPATDAVVGAVPAAKSGVASATNTVARMVSGALGVAVIGSLISSLYSNDVEGSLTGLPTQAQARADDSVGAASAIAAQLPGDAASSLLATAGAAFTQAMGTGLLVAAALAAGTAVVVLRFLPAREPAEQAEGAGPGQPSLVDADREPLDLQPQNRKEHLMSSLNRSNNVAARMARWSARHRKIAIFGWLGLVIIAVLIGKTAGTKELRQDDAIPGESGRATRIVDAQFAPKASETVLVQSKTLTADDRAFRTAVDDVLTSVKSFAIVGDVDSPYARGNGAQVSQDRHSALVNFEFKSSAEDAMNISKPVEDAVAAVQAAHPSLTIAQFGDGSSAREVEGQFTRDLGKAGLLSLPVTLVILLITFGALFAAGIPLLLALTSVIATMFLIALPSHLMPVDAQVKEVILLIGLAVGVDYSLFYLKREREERAAGRSESAALEAAAATSGRSVLISGFTVMIAMAGMFFAGDPGFSSFALGTIMVVAIAMLGSLTVLPALLSKLGDRVDKGRVPLLGRLQREGGEGRLWGRILDRVLARPGLSAVISGGVLVAIAVPALGMKTVQVTPEALPQNLKAVQTYNRIQRTFPSELHNATVVLKAANVNAPEIQAAVAELRNRAAATVVPQGSIETDVNSRGTAETISVPLAGNGSDALSESGVVRLRNEIIPDTLGAFENIEYGLTGGTAIDLDGRSAMKTSAPLVFAFVLIFAFALLLVSFRSLVIAAKAVILNLLSIAAAYGVLVLVFQHGLGKGLIGFDYTGGIISFLPIFMFVILFGLSMDYHVFIISRIREARDRGLSTEEAVTHGIKTTAGVVTSAAIVMVCVFAVFATGSIILLQQLGIGLAAAILIDATLVRAVLLPASMMLLGDRNWYLPKWLEWLPHLDHGDTIENRNPPAAPPALEPTA